MYLSGGQENGKRQTMPFRSVIMTDVMSYGIHLFFAFSYPEKPHLQYMNGAVCMAAVIRNS